jgi:hypothetical protein
MTHALCCAAEPNFCNDGVMELMAKWHHPDIPAPACHSKQGSSFFLPFLFGLASKLASAKAREVTCTARSLPSGQSLLDLYEEQSYHRLSPSRLANIILSPPDLSKFRLVVWSCTKLAPWTKMTQKSTRLCPNGTGRQTDSGVLPWAWSALAWTKMVDMNSVHSVFSVKGMVHCSNGLQWLLVNIRLWHL